MRTRWLAVAATVVAVVGIAAVAGQGLVHTSGRSSVVLAAAPAAAASSGATDDTLNAASDASTTSSPATVPPAVVPAVAPAVVPAVVPATTVAPATAPSTIGTKALALISYPWTKLGYTLTFHGPKAGYYGLTDCHTHNIDIYVTPGQGVAQVAYITAFEIGHAIDCGHIADGHQARWPALRGYQLTGPWFPSCACSEDNFSSGDFSDVFARWQVGPAYAFRSTLAPPPSAAQMAALIPMYG